MASLRKYQQKRIFNKTVEPKGGPPRKIKNKPLRFVVQKHQASHLHFDFRLESEGVLKSWAVPKGIPSEGEKHLAMMVEDHPLEYQNFEGIIPPGNYGAGKVIVWDHGEYLLKDQMDNSQLSYKIEKGEFGFSLQGEKIRGEFSMVRLKKAQENAWLLIARKVEDKDKLNEDRSVVSGLLIEEIGKTEFEIEKYLIDTCWAWRKDGPLAGSFIKQNH